MIDEHRLRNGVFSLSFFLSLHFSRRIGAMLELGVQWNTLRRFPRHFAI